MSRSSSSSSSRKTEKSKTKRVNKKKRGKSKDKHEIIVISRSVKSIPPILEEREGYTNYWSDLSKTMGEISQHVEIYFPKKEIYFTSYISIGVSRKRMNKERLTNTSCDYRIIYHISLSSDEVCDVFNFCNSRVGKNYNSNGIFAGALMPKMIRSCDKSETYTCSSLIMKALIKSRTMDRCIKNVSEEYRQWGNESYFNDVRPDKVVRILTDLTRRYNRSDHPDGKLNIFRYTKSKKYMRVHFHITDKRSKPSDFNSQQLKESRNRIISEMYKQNDINDYSDFSDNDDE